jgi:hypothetical protein
VLKTGLAKTRVFLKKSPARWVFLGSIGFYWVLLGFLGFIGFYEILPVLNRSIILQHVLTIPVERSLVGYAIGMVNRLIFN